MKCLCCFVLFFCLQSASLVSMVTAAIRPAPVLMAVPVTPSTDAAPALQVSMATTVSKVELCMLNVTSPGPVESHSEF